MKTVQPLKLIIVLLFWSVCGMASDKSLMLRNAGFELLDGRGMPAGWIFRQENEDYSVIRMDVQDPKSGEKSLCIEHRMSSRSTVISEPVELTVGHLYRLSAWVKTEKAFTADADRYPTPVAGCITMASFPFTVHSPAAGGSSGWQKLEMLFIATTSRDSIRLHLGYNGGAAGKIWYDDVELSLTDDISLWIPPETVRWFGPAFRYEDKGWIFLHVEGKPYERGYQHGYLMADEILSYLEKLAIQGNEKDPGQGWEIKRTMTDAMMMRGYDEEYLTEMQGIADGTEKAGVKFRGKTLDLLDIAALNSEIDIGQMGSALYHTAHPLSGTQFLSQEDDLLIPEALHRCSGFLSNGPASKDERIVFGQLFMWGGYTGTHWNVICDLVPEKGYRLVYETFPGGIHSGSDFYINGAGIMIGETTTIQTPFNPGGTPQSNRIRKAAQYAKSIDDVVKILSGRNNGLYTNDWLIGDTKTDEIAIFLLGTQKSKLWRSRSGEFPGGTEGFYFSDNTNKDPEVRKEYIPNPDNAPYDLAYRTSNRDLAFMEFYRNMKGRIDAVSGVRFWASSPINRPHACDGKITTSEMAEQLVFLAHYGKVTLREKFPGENNRIPDLPGAVPHLTLGYSVISPVFVTDRLKAVKQGAKTEPIRKENDLTGTGEIYSFDRRLLWHNTVFPSDTKENWLVSGSAAYYASLNALPEDEKKACRGLTDDLTELNCRLVYVMEREGAIRPLEAEQVYDRYSHYQIPRIRGMLLLHQMRLLVGNGVFSKIMNAVHDRFREKTITTEQWIAVAEQVSGKPLKPFIMQWIGREDIPHPSVDVKVDSTGDGWKVGLSVKQPGIPFHFLTTVSVETESACFWRKIEVVPGKDTQELVFIEKPLTVIFNAGNDIPVPRENPYTFSNYYDDFQHTVIIYGTSRQIEANHTLALRYATVLADRFAEVLPPVKKDCEISEGELAASDLIVLGGREDNSLTSRLAGRLGLVLGKNMFQWNGKTYGSADEGFIAVFPNPFGNGRIVYLLIANSALELYRMTKVVHSVPAWAVFRGSEIVEKGYHSVAGFDFRISSTGF